MKKVKQFVIFLVMIAILIIPQESILAAPEQSEQSNLKLEQIEIDGALAKSDIFHTTKYYASNSNWDIYASDYYYAQLSTTEKQFYDNLNAACLNYMNSSDNAITRVVEGKNEAMTTFMAYPGMSYSEAYNVALIFIFSNPQYYFLNNNVFYNTTYGNNYISLGMYMDYADGSSRNTTTNTFKNTVDGWISQVKSESGDYNKAKKAHDIVVTNVSYNANTYDQSAISFLNSKTTVCSGYSKMYELLCDAADLETLCVTSSEHAWNKIQIGGTWYNVDCTWDDTDPGFTYYYFAKSDRTIESGNSYHTVQRYWTTYTTLPACDVDYSSETSQSTSGITTYNGVDYSAVYNYSYYVSKYPDLKSAFGNDQYKTIEHFVNHGMKEARQASSAFNVTIYKDNYKDLRQNFKNDLPKYYMHFINAGKAEDRNAISSNGTFEGITTYNGVDYAPVYNYNYYISHYPDLAKAFPNDDEKTLEHFVNFGMAEGRVAKDNFDVKAYRAANKDLRQIFGSDLSKYYMHYIQSGRYENRITTGSHQIAQGVTTYNGVDYSAVYNYNYYIATYPDLAKAFPDDDVATLKHFVEFGMKEGRNASPDFVLATYKNNNADLGNAFGDDNASYYMHYIQRGKAENRIAK